MFNKECPISQNDRIAKVKEILDRYEAPYDVIEKISREIDDAYSAPSRVVALFNRIVHKS
jgi:hypothetical protein